MVSGKESALTLQPAMESPGVLSHFIRALESTPFFSQLSLSNLALFFVFFALTLGPVRSALKTYFVHRFLVQPSCPLEPT